MVDIWLDGLIHAALWSITPMMMWLAAFFIHQI